MTRGNNPQRSNYPISEKTREVIGEIPGVVEIGGNLYLKSPEALELLLKTLEDYGYEIKECSRDERRPPREVQEQEGWYLWYASLGDSVLQRRGKCESCQSYIDVCGIRSHGHTCEVCGAVTYEKIIDGSVVRFKFLSEKNRGMFSPQLCMRAKRWDTKEGYLYLYYEFLDRGSLGVVAGKEAQTYLSKNAESWEVVEEDDQKLLKVRYPQPWDRQVAAIEPYDIWGSRSNHTIVKLFKGEEFSEWGRLPVRESYSLYEAWHWSPLIPTPNLHERIIRAAGMVTDCGWYHHAVREGNLRSMRRFVAHFTTLNLAEWDRMIARAPRSGPGMITAVAYFCHPEPQIKNEPNLGNVLAVLGNTFSGKPNTTAELAAAERALRDPEERAKIAPLLEALQKKR